MSKSPDILILALGIFLQVVPGIAQNQSDERRRPLCWRLVAVGIYGTGTAWLIDVSSGKILDRQKVSDLGCGSVAFSPDGRYLITPSTGGLITWPYDVGGTIRVFKVAP
jgi:WD40 repeat protein